MEAFALCTQGTGVSGETESTGLCASCRQVEVVVSAKRSRFVFCRRSRDDARFPRYPKLPVTRCEGYDPRGQAPSSGVA